MRFKSRGSSLLSRRVSIRKTASAVPVGGQRGCRTSERPGGNRPIAAILTAFSPSRRSRHYARAAIASVGPRMAIPSGRLPVCQLNLWPDSRFGEKGLALQTRSPAPSHDFRTGSRANGKGETGKTLIAPLAGLRNSSTARLNTARGPSSNSHQKRMSGSVFACPGNQVLRRHRPESTGRKYFRRFWTHS
jgi:hypothetical protein